MDQEPDNDTEIKPPPKPVIPPPDLSRPPPPPPSPMDGLPKSTPPPVPSGGGGVKVTLRTARDESADQGVVTFNTRIIAAVIDMVVAMGITIGLILLLPGFANKLAYLTGLAYLVTRDSLPFLGGQSVGKKAMKIKVVTLDGASLVGKWEAAVVRNGILIIPLFPLVELFILLTREDKPERGRRLGDEWAKTRIIVEEKPPAAEEIG